MASSSTPLRKQAITAATSAASILGLLGTLYWLDIPSLFQQRIKSRKVKSRCYSVDDKPSLTAFKTLIEQTTLKETYPLADSIEKNIPIYNCSHFPLDSTSTQLASLQDEFYHCLLHGPGVFVLQNFFPDTRAIDAANSAYATIIAREQAAAAANPTPQGDHFAAAGSNARIWNAFSKHCHASPAAFLAYYSNPWFRVVSEAYLGPAYRLTAQVNVVKPGGKAQVSHRDYHLGFQSAAEVVRWPRAVHAASALLTLQGAVAHSDMPLESGPTRFLPWSQGFAEGFVACRWEEFDAVFLERWVSLELKKGDAVFFSPALIHAAGENGTVGFERSANLIQVSSAFGKTMETVDSLPLVEMTFDLLRDKFEKEGWSVEVDAAVRAVAEGYPFPTNLDRRPPAPGGMAPESEQDVLKRALVERWDKGQTIEAFRQIRLDSQA